LEELMWPTFAIAVLIAFVVVGLHKERIHDISTYHRGLGLFLASLILVFAVPKVLVIGPAAAAVTVPVGTILGFCSVFVLCRALVSTSASQEPTTSENS